jgi:hypothetical protein
MSISAGPAETEPSERPASHEPPGRPTCARPTALVVLREDHEFMLAPSSRSPASRSATSAMGGHSSGEDPALSIELGSGT